MSWFFAPYGIVRMAGFPFALATLLDDATVYELGEAVVASRAARRQAARDRKKKVPGAMGAEAAEAAVREAEAQLAASLDVHLSSVSCLLRQEFRDDPLLMGAVAVSNEDAWTRLRPWLQDRARDGETSRTDRRNTETLSLYAQRLCTKNDTASHFGPFAPILLEGPEGAGSVTRGSRRRFPLLSRWATETIRAAMQQDARLRPLLPVRVAPGFVARAHPQDSLWLLFDHRKRQRQLSDVLSVRHLSLAPEVLTLLGTLRQREHLRLCDAVRIYSAISGDEGANDLVEELLTKEVLELGPFVPYGEGDPIPFLVDALPAGDHRVPILNEIASHIRAFGQRSQPDETADLAMVDALVRAGFGAPVESKDAATFYSDRSFVHEECVGPVREVTFPTSAATNIFRQAEPIVDLFMSRSRVAHGILCSEMDAWFNSVFSTGEATFADFAEACVTRQAELAAVSKRVQETGDVFNAFVWDALGIRPGEHEHVLDPKVVAEIVKRADGAPPAVCNPDIMISSGGLAEACTGSFELVIGDLHADEENLTHSLFGPTLTEAYPDLPVFVTNAYTSLIEENEALLDATLFHRNKTFIRHPLPVPDVVFQDDSPASQEAVLMESLCVVSRRGRLRLCQNPDGPFFRLITLPFAWTGIDFNPFAIFGFPQRDGRPLIPIPEGESHMPRLRHERAVIQRESWSFEPELFVQTKLVDQMSRMIELCREFGLPEQFFVKSSDEPKPVFVSVRSPLLVKALFTMASNTSAPLKISEFFPSEAGLWLDPGSGKVTSEIRCFAYQSSKEQPSE